jgi:hypothetical protein
MASHSASCALFFSYDAVIAVVFAASYALLDGGANVDFVTPPRHESAGCTPLMYAVIAQHTGITKLLLERGADGTKKSTQATPGQVAGGTALDIARGIANALCLGRGLAKPDVGDAGMLALLSLMCCSTCGVTSVGRGLHTSTVRHILSSI